jgi:hypothetical protein
MFTPMRLTVEGNVFDQVIIIVELRDQAVQVACRDVMPPGGGSVIVFGKVKSIQNTHSDSYFNSDTIAKPGGGSVSLVVGFSWEFKNVNQRSR